MDNTFNFINQLLGNMNDYKICDNLFEIYYLYKIEYDIDHFIGFHAMLSLKENNIKHQIYKIIKRGDNLEFRKVEKYNLFDSNELFCDIIKKQNIIIDENKIKVVIDIYVIFFMVVYEIKNENYNTVLIEKPSNNLVISNIGYNYLERFQSSNTEYINNGLKPKPENKTEAININKRIKTKHKKMSNNSNNLIFFSITISATMCIGYAVRNFLFNNS
jgi:hypothetical protein